MGVVGPAVAFAGCWAALGQERLRTCGQGTENTVTTMSTGDLAEGLPERGQPLRAGHLGLIPLAAPLTTPRGQPLALQ